MRLCIVWLCSLLFVSTAYANLNIGVVDLRKAVVAVKDGQRAQKKLKAQQDKFKRKLKREADKLKKYRDKIKVRLKILKGTARERVAVKLRKKIINFQRMQAELARKLRIEEAKLMRVVMQKMQRVIQIIVRKNDLDLMLTKRNNVIHANASLDFTNDLIRRYNRIYGGGRRSKRSKKRRRRRRKRSSN